MALLNKDEQRQVAEAIDRLERRTDAELVTVLAAGADDYAYMPLIWAGLVGLLLPGVINYFLDLLSADELLLAQMSTFILVALLCRIPAIISHLVPAPVRRWRAGNLARRQFLEQNLHNTTGGTGILVFVCEAERYVEILVDHGIANRLHGDTWKAMVDVFTQQIRDGQTLQGFLGCIHACGELLADHVPVTRERSELTNRLVVLG
ncbi:TPM domain-containing protein [Pseudomonas sp. NPDC089734]|uniref:TPM domain-containing protein n=1 Tax=Pseudomonas sp. NPDC089734 TaxID=3364469 RepID=UPI00381BD7DA